MDTNAGRPNMLTGKHSRATTRAQIIYLLAAAKRPLVLPRTAHNIIMTAVITADIALKSANVDLGFVDRFSGTLIVTGKVAEVDSAFTAIGDYFRDTLKFTVCEKTRT